MARFQGRIAAVAGATGLLLVLASPAQAHDGPELEITLTPTSVAAGSTFVATVTTDGEPCIDLSLTFGNDSAHSAGGTFSHTFTAPPDASGELPVVAACEFVDNHDGQTSATSQKSTWITVTAATSAPQSAGPPSTSTSAQDDSADTDKHLGVIVAISLGTAVVVVGLAALWWRRARHP